MKRVKLYYIVAYPEKGSKGLHLEYNIEMTEDELKKFIDDFETKNKCEVNAHYGYMDKI